VPFVIDVDPVALSLLGLQIRWYGLILLLASAAAFWIALREAARRGVGAEVVGDAAIWVAVSALVGGRALYILQNELGMLGADPLHAFMVWQGGLSFYGGLIAGLVALLIFARRRGLPALLVLDLAALAAALGQAVGHVGCLIGGDSYGIPTSLPWGVVYENPGAMAPLGVALHPTQLYESLGLIIVFALLWRWREPLERYGTGALAGLYLIGLASLRFALFFLRDESPVLLGLKTAQWIGLGIGVIGVVLLAVAVRRSAVEQSSAAAQTSTLSLEVSQS
jgi:phosphatidylglycerol:prolipoprotein diacylglycerol transferase